MECDTFDKTQSKLEGMQRYNKPRLAKVFCGQKFLIRSRCEWSSCKLSGVQFMEYTCMRLGYWPIAEL